MQTKYLKSSIIIVAGIIFIINIIGNNIIAQSSEENLSCSGDTCFIDENYTYDANIKDPKCWYNINFCNIDFNITIPSNAGQVITLLKQVNYQQQEDVTMYKSKYENNKLYMYIIIGLVILVAIWNMVLLSKYRRLQYEKKIF